MARGKIEKRGQRRRKIKPVILIVIFVWSAAAPAEVKQIISA